MEYVRWNKDIKPPSRNATCIWIYIDAPGFDRSRLSLPDGFRLSRDDHEIQVLWIDDDKEVVDSECYPLSIESIDVIAEKYNILSGKWMVFRPSQTIDDTWEVIAKSVSEGRLGVSAKVASTLNKTVTGKEDYLICVYTEDYRDEADVTRVREVLRELGISERIYYKPDIYTYLRIYSGKSRIQATKYHG